MKTQSTKITSAYLAILVLFFAVGLVQADSVVEKWVTRYNGPGNGPDYVRAITLDSSGNIYITGTIYDGSTHNDYATIKYDANGTQKWLATYNGPDNDTDYPSSIAVDSLGNVFVTGYSVSSSTRYDLLTIKYDANGTEKWVVRYNGPGNGDDIANALALDSAGNVYISGWSLGTGSSSDFITIKYDTNGNQLWLARTGGNGFAMTLDSSANVYVAGCSYNTTTNLDIVIVKYDTNGNQLWASTYNGPGNTDDAVYGVAVDNSENVYVTGSSIGAADYNYTTVKFNSNGVQLWAASYDGPAHYDEEASKIVVDSSGNAYITGFSFGIGTDGDYATIKYDTNGNQKWVARYNGPTNRYDEAVAIALDKWNNVYVTGASGFSYSYDSFPDYATVKYDTDGNQKWAVRYNGPAGTDDSAGAIAVDSSGNVFVTGRSTGIGSDFDITTIKYAQHGYCKTAITGDFNSDCKVNFVDFATLASHWLECNYALPEDCL